MKRMLGVLMAILLLLGAAAALADGIAYVVNPNSEDRLHLRTEASSGATSLGRYYTGTKVETLGTSGDFTKVRIGKQTGYMMTRYLKSEAEALDLLWAVVAPPSEAEKVTLRETAGEKAKAISSCTRGEVVQVMGLVANGGYVHVRTMLADGYLPRDAVQIDGESPRTTVLPITEGYIGAATNVRAYPSLDAPPVIQASSGEVRVLGQAGGWHYWRFPMAAPTSVGLCMGDF